MTPPELVTPAPACEPAEDAWADHRAALDRGMAYRVTLLLRPETFNEPSLLACWSALAPWPVLVLSLTPAHNAPHPFLVGLVRSLSAGISIPDAVLAYKPPLTLVDGITDLLNAATMAPGDFAWVFRNYDLITDAVIHQAVGWMLDYAPPQLHLYLTSNREPALLNLPRLRVRRHLLALHLPITPP